MIHPAGSLGVRSAFHTGGDQRHDKLDAVRQSPGPRRLHWHLLQSLLGKDDVTAAMNNLFQLNSQGFELMNSANIVLLPQKEDALRITDYRPISLIHSFVKIFSKLLANRLAPLLNWLVSSCQSAFIKKEKHPRQFLICPYHSTKTSQTKNPGPLFEAGHPQSF